jgi:hypothetical protein
VTAPIRRRLAIANRMQGRSDVDFRGIVFFALGYGSNQPAVLDAFEAALDWQDNPGTLSDLIIDPQAKS